MEEIKDEMNVTIRDNDKRVSFFKILRMGMKRRLEIFANEATIVGLSFLVKPSNHKIGSIIRKIVWTMLLLFGTGFMVYQIYDRITYYQTYPTIVDYRVAYKRSLRFPTVTICPESVVSRKNLLSLGPAMQSIASNRYAPALNIGLEDEDRMLNFEKLDFDWSFFYSVVAVKVEDWLVECSFANQPCQSSEAIKQIETVGGYCLLFNPVTANYVTTQPGANNGLRLVLWVNQSETYMTMSPAVGFKVVLHDPYDEPPVSDLGFRVGTGVSTSVSFSLRNLSMLPQPYGDCRDEENYTYEKCMKHCMDETIFTACKCQLYGFGGNNNLCSLDKYNSCVRKAVTWWISSGAVRKCKCPLQCHIPTYPNSISTSPLSEHFLNYMSQKTQFKGRSLTMSKLGKELVYLDIFYSELNYIDIQTTPAYDFLTLVCDIGGALGLILGGTILTIAEVSQFFVQLLNEFATAVRFAKMQRR